MFLKNYLLPALCLFALSTFAQQGTLDSTFSGDGKLILMPSNSHDNANAVLIQPDSSILFAGGSTTVNVTGYDVIVGRLHPDGNLDSSFGTNGYVILDYNGYYDIAYDIDLTDEGKILVTGAVSNTAAKINMFVMRLNPNGSYDTAFGDSGIVVPIVNSNQDYGKEAVVQPDGKIVLGGYLQLSGNNQAVLVRLNSDGSVDSTFGSAGISIPNIPTTSEQIEGLVLKPNGSFIAVGYETTVGGEYGYLWGILPDGSLDPSFGTNGSLSIFGLSRAKSIVEGNNQYYTCGTSFGAVQVGYVVATSDSGILNSSFGAFGILRDTLNNGVGYNDLKVQQDGKIVVVGGTTNASSDFLVTRFNTNSTLDSSFGSNGHAAFDLINQNNENAQGVAIQEDGKIVVCGTGMQTNNDIAIIRLNGATTTTTGITQLNLRENSVVIYPNPSNGNFIISFPTPVKNQTVRVINLLGETVFTASLNNESEKEINLRNVSTGIYFVEVTGDGGNTTVKKMMIY